MHNPHIAFKHSLISGVGTGGARGATGPPSISNRGAAPQ